MSFKSIVLLVALIACTSSVNAKEEEKGWHDENGWHDAKQITGLSARVCRIINNVVDLPCDLVDATKAVLSGESISSELAFHLSFHKHCYARSIFRTNLVRLKRFITLNRSEKLSPKEMRFIINSGDFAEEGEEYIEKHFPSHSEEQKKIDDGQ